MSARALLATLLLSACAEAPAPAVQADDTPLHRLVAILEYVAADYGGAVQDGKIASAAEYEEQKAFLESARPLVPAAQAQAFAQLESRVNALASARDVAEAAHRARDEIVRAHGLALAPSARPDRARGAALYTQTCVVCHGADGRADTPRARELDPRPVSFFDETRAATLTPYKAFNTMTFGLEGTAMASFKEALGEKDRWDLAFHVFALRHAGQPTSAPAHKPSLRHLTTTADPALGGTPEEVAWMRVTGVYEDVENPFDTARALLARALAEPDPQRAQDLVLDAYLRGMEPAEGRVRARDAALVSQIERAFLELRGAIREGRDVSAAGHSLRALLDRAEDMALGSNAGARTLAIGAGVIVLREGLEAVLLIAAILAALARMGRRDLRRYVHAGWAAALAAGVATWLAAQAVIGLFANREAAEGWVSLAAAAVLFYCGFWLVSQNESKKWVSWLKASVRASALALFGVAFLAVYREAAETVLFFQSLILEAGGRAGPLLLGSAAGAAILAAMVALVFGLGKRLPAAPFFTATGALMYLLAVIFAGKGIHALQIAGVVRPHPIGLPDVPSLGFHGDALVAAAQAALLAVFLISIAASFLKRSAAPIPEPGETK